MTTPKDLYELADRVEALDGPCREIDAEIYGKVVLGAKLQWEHGGRTLTAYVDDNDFALGFTTFLNHIREFTSLEHVPKFTASVDVALTLMPEVSEIEITTIYGNTRVVVDLAAEEPCYSSIEGRIERGDMALAITAASLRARAREVEDV